MRTLTFFISKTSLAELIFKFTSINVIRPIFNTKFTWQLSLIYKWQSLLFYWY